MFRQSGGSLFCERFPAFDGRRLDEPAMYVPKHRGCALSHIELWRRAAGWSEPTMICEDDAVVVEADYERELSPDDTILYCGFNWDAPICISFGLGPVVVHLSQNALRDALTQGPITIAAKPQSWPLHHAFGTCCYIVTPRGAQWLLENALTFTPGLIEAKALGYSFGNHGIDGQLNLFLTRMGARVLFPPFAFTPNEH